MSLSGLFFRSMVRCLAIVFVLTSFVSKGSAQNFPVDVNLQVLPPYSPAFHTFGQSQAVQSNKLMLQVSLKDLVRPSLDVGLQFEFRGPNGVFKTDPSLILNPILVQQGVPTLLGNIDLNTYFLTPGLAESLTNADGFMPEGDWEICVTAYELLNQEQVSRTTCFYMFLEEYDPPEILMPEDSILPTYPTNVQLLWQPLHLGGFPVRYEVEIWETLPGFTDQQIVETTLPYYVGETQNVTTHFYAAADPPLVVGQEYLMRVRIQDNVNAPMGPPVYAFKNQGFSNIHRFKYGMQVAGQVCTDPSKPEFVVDDSLHMYVFWDDGEPPVYNYVAPVVGTGVSSTAMNQQSVGLSSANGTGGSQGLGGGSSTSSSAGTSIAFSGFYKMYYRDITDGAEGEWNAVETEEAWVLFDDYRRGRTYEVYVSRVCSAEERQSESVEISIPVLPPERDFECGMPMLPIDISNQELLPMLNVGDTIMAADFRVSIREVSGSNGVFTGKGAFQTGLFNAAIEVEFDGITVNTEYRMIDGFIKTTYDPRGSNIYNLDSLWSSFNLDQEPDFPSVNIPDLDTVYFNEAGELVIEPSSGSYEAPLYITSDNGNFLAISGMVLPQTEFAKPSSLSSDYQVAFTTKPTYNYGLDLVDDNLPDGYVRFDGEPIPHKAVAYQGRDKIDAFMSIAKGGWTVSDWDSVQVVTEDGFMLEFSVASGDSRKIEIWTPGLDKDQNVYVMYGEECMGVYSNQVFTFTDLVVNVIPLNGAGVSLDYPEIETRLNKILGQGVFGVQLNFLEDQGLDEVPAELSGERYGLKRYKDDMLDILKAHRQLHGQDRNQMYLFIHPNMKDDVVGYMPIGYNAGFIEAASSTEEMVVRMAHELGHGALTLEHYFELADVPENSTSNLMDYDGGTSLNYLQWQQMHNRGGLKVWFQGSDDGQYRIGEGKISCLTIAEVSEMGLQFDFIDPNQKVVTIPADAYPRGFYNTGNEGDLVGVLHSFVSQNQIYELHYEVSEPPVFVGYAIRNNVNDPQPFTKRVYPYTPKEGKATKVVIDSITQKASVFIGGVDIPPPYENISGVCPVGTGGLGGSKIFNLTKEDIDDLEVLEKLLGGEKTIFDVLTDRQFRDSRAMLFVTNGKTSEDSLQWAKDYVTPFGVQKIWIHGEGEEFVLKNEVRGIKTLDSLMIASGHESLLGQLKGGITELSKIVYELSDLVSKGIAKAKIPRHIWDPEHENHDPLYGDVYRIITLPLTPVVSVVERTSEVNLNDAEFAALCGVWNGVIEFARGVPELTKLVTGITSGELKLGEMLQTMNNYQNPADTTQTGKWEFFKAMMGEALPVGNPPVLAHNLTEFVVTVGLGIFAGGSTVASGKFGKLLLVLKVLDKVESAAFTLIGKFAGTSLRLVTKGGKRFIGEVNDAILTTERLIADAWVRTDINLNVDGSLILRATYPNGQNAEPVFRILQSDGTDMIVRTARKVSTKIYDDFASIGISNLQVDELLKRLDDNVPDLEKLHTALAKAPDATDFTKLADDLIDPKGFDLLRKIVDDGDGVIANAWKIFDQNKRSLLKFDPQALDRFLKLRAHSKFTSLGLTDNMAASIRGIDGVSYNQMLDELERAMDILPADKTSNFSQIIQTGNKRGLINNNPLNGIYDRRHSWLTLKTIQENANFFMNAKSIEFEAVLETIDGIPQSVPDIKAVVSQNGLDRIKIGEVYAGSAGAKSNLGSQTLTYVQQVSDLRDLRFFRRLNIADKPAAKQAVIDAWKNGGVTGDERARELFTDFYNSFNDNQLDITFTKGQLENYLQSTDGWFDTIFNSAF